jgi:hypothetical protein
MRSGLWRHKKKCSQSIVSNIELQEPLENTMALSRSNIDNNLIVELIKQNGELQRQNEEIMKQLVEIVKESKMLNNGTVNNNTFNLQLFLNETCKDGNRLSEVNERKQKDKKHLLMVLSKSIISKN